MTVRNRLILTFIVTGGLLILPSLFAAQRLSELRELAVGERDRHASALAAVGEIQEGLQQLYGSLRSYVILGGQPSEDALIYRDAARDALAAIAAEVVRIRDAGYSEAVPPLATEVDSLVSVADRLVRLVGEDEAEAEALFTGPFGERMSTVRERLVQMAGVIDRRAQADFRRAQTISADARRNTVLAVFVAVVLAVLLSWWTTSALTSPLLRVRTAMARVADGSFEAPSGLPYDRDDEIGDLASSFRTMATRLAELDRIKAEFMGVASHELKTPINVIRGYTELIEEELIGGLTDNQREILHRIAEQTRVLTRQVSRLMDISRLETGSYAVEVEPVLMGDLILGVRRAYEILADEKGVEFTTEVADDAPERLVIDIDLIRDEVLGNLVSNAIKFTPEGGEVRVRAWGEREGAVIEVSDTGPGIPESHRPHVFDKYYQVERSRSMGSGLGLAIAREMVEAHGGSIELVENEEPGATFRLYLPAEYAVEEREVRIST